MLKCLISPENGIETSIGRKTQFSFNHFDNFRTYSTNFNLFDTPNQSNINSTSNSKERSSFLCDENFNFLFEENTSSKTSASVCLFLFLFVLYL